MADYFDSFRNRQASALLQAVKFPQPGVLKVQLPRPRLAGKKCGMEKAR
jgi:hypothetical protein